MARRRLHVQRRVGRLLRRSAKMRARTGRTTARTWSRSAANARENAQEQRTERQRTARRTRHRARRSQRTERQAQTRQQRRTEAQARDAGDTRVAARREARGYSGGTQQTAARHAAAPARTPSRATRAENRSAPPARAGRAAGAARAAAAAAAAAPLVVEGRRMTDDEARQRSSLSALVACAACGARVVLARPPAPAASNVRDAGRSGAGAHRGGQERDTWTRCWRSSGRTGRSWSTRPIRRPRRRNREVFTVAVAEGWRLVDAGPHGKTLVIGNEDWPFPVPLVQGGERLAIRHGRGKRGSARAPHRTQRAGGDSRSAATYVAAQRLYAQQRTRRQARRPVCDDVPQRSGPAERPVLAGRATGRSAVRWATCVAEAADEGRPASADRAAAVAVSRLLLQDPDRAGRRRGWRGKDYVVDGEMSGGFALVAWPAQ